MCGGCTSRVVRRIWVVASQVGQTSAAVGKEVAFEFIHVLRGHRGPVVALDFLPDGPPLLLASGGRDAKGLERPRGRGQTVKRPEAALRDKDKHI